MEKKLIELKEGDKLYCIGVIESDIQEINSHCMQEKTITRVIRTIDMLRVVLVLDDNTTIQSTINATLYVDYLKPNDEINLSFKVYSTSKEKCVEEAQRLIYERLKTLDIIKRRVRESETGLLLADAALELIDTKEEEELTEELASMALG